MVFTMINFNVIKIILSMVYSFLAVICLVLYVSFLLIWLQALCQSSKFSLLRFSTTKSREPILSPWRYLFSHWNIPVDGLDCPLFQVHPDTTSPNQTAHFLDLSFRVKVVSSTAHIKHFWFASLVLHPLYI